MRFRTSIAGLMGLVLLVGIEFAALRTASALWASGLFTAAFVATTAAAIGALATRGRARATWGGFALACGSYVGVVFGPLAAPSGVRPPPLLSTLIFNWTSTKIGDPSTVYFVDGPENSLDNASTFYSSSSDMSLPPPPEFENAVIFAPNPPPPSQPQRAGSTIFLIHHFRIGHSLMGILLGVAGAAFGSWLHRRSAKGDAWDRVRFHA